MSPKIPYSFTASPWQYPSPGGWVFVSLPEGMSEEIRSLLRSEEEGWGRMKVRANIGESSWDTAIWFDTKRNTYLLPLKAEIRKKEKVRTGENIEVQIWV